MVQPKGKKLAQQEEARLNSGINAPVENVARPLSAKPILTPAATVSLLRSPMAGAQRRALVQSLAQNYGNRQVQRVLAEVQRACNCGTCAGCRQEKPETAEAVAVARTLNSVTVIQRYSVPSTLECDEVVNWLTSNSPYAPEWAETRCNYSFNGGLRITRTTTASGDVELTARGHPGVSVSMQAPIDQPNWSPSARSGRPAVVAAWNNMRTTLNAHEHQHRQIGRDWQTILQNRFRTITVSASGPDNATARANLVQEIANIQQQWTAEAQAAQTAIDPFTGAVLACP